MRKSARQSAARRKAPSKAKKSVRAKVKNKTTVPKTKRVAKKKTGAPTKKKPRKKPPAGFRRNPGGKLFVPTDYDDGQTVPVSKLQKGIAAAKDELQRIADSLIDALEGYEVRHVDMTASFSADGKFLGIGVGGATSITIRLAPSDEE